MQVLTRLLFSALSVSGVFGVILQNGQVRHDPYPGQAPLIDDTADSSSWKNFGPDAAEISYKGRWDAQHISWWSAPGLQLEFTGHELALGFGQYTDPDVLVAYRLGGLDWQFSNVTANSTYQFIGCWTSGLNETTAEEKKSFELRASVAVAADGDLSRPTTPSKTLEVIGDSLSIGQFASYEGLSSWAYILGAGLNDTDYSITAYSGICLHDQECWGNKHGQVYQWYHTCDSSPRARDIYGSDPPKWNFGAHAPADLVIINLGANDDLKGVSGTDFESSYVTLIDSVHAVWPEAQVIIMSLWGVFEQKGLSFEQYPQAVHEIENVYRHYQDEGKAFVHYFDTMGLFKHSDIAEQGHLNDIGNIKLAGNLMQWIEGRFGWERDTAGAEILHGTQYWNTEESY